MSQTIKKGYIAAPKHGRSVFTARKYPFPDIKEGEYLDPPYPWSDRVKVKSAVRYFNATTGGCLHVNMWPQGKEGHPAPCCEVGWLPATS